MTVIKLPTMSYDHGEPPMIGDVVAPNFQPSLRALVVDLDHLRGTITVHFDVGSKTEVVQSPVQYTLVKRGR